MKRILRYILKHVIITLLGAMAFLYIYMRIRGTGAAGGEFLLIFSSVWYEMCRDIARELIKDVKILLTK